MLNKNEIKDIQSLSQKKFRRALKLFVAEGPKIVAELLLAVPERVEKVYALPQWIEANPQLAHRAIVPVTESELEKLSMLPTPNSVVAVLRQWETPPAHGGFTLYLDTIQDPGNFGTIIRIADWFGITQVVCTPGCAEHYHPKVVQSTMASIARVAVRYDEDAQWLQGHGGPVYAASLRGTPLYGHAKTDSGVLVIGNESKGISASVMRHATETITIPRTGAAESLNAAVATGIILSHLL